MFGCAYDRCGHSAHSDRLWQFDTQHINAIGERPDAHTGERTGTERAGKENDSSDARTTDRKGRCDLRTDQNKA
jgi:hypothetical protein